MACEEQQAVVEELERTLKSLLKALQSAPPGREMEIVQQLAGARERLALAKSDLADCLQRGEAEIQVIPVEVSIEVQYSGAFARDKSHRAQLHEQLTLIGSGESRVVTMKPFTIEQEARISVAAQKGDFAASTGAMDLPGVVAVRFAGVEQRGQVTLTTGSASSPSGRYAGSGSRLDPDTLAMVLVGGGAVTVSLLGQELTYEYFISASCLLAARPTASR